MFSLSCRLKLLSASLCMGSADCGACLRTFECIIHHVNKTCNLCASNHQTASRRLGWGPSSAPTLYLAVPWSASRHLRTQVSRTSTCATRPASCYLPPHSAALEQIPLLVQHGATLHVFLNLQASLFVEHVTPCFSSKAGSWHIVYGFYYVYIFVYSTRYANLGLAVISAACTPYVSTYTSICGCACVYFFETNSRVEKHN